MSEKGDFRWGPWNTLIITDLVLSKSSKQLGKLDDMLDYNSDDVSACSNRPWSVSLHLVLTQCCCVWNNCREKQTFLWFGSPRWTPGTHHQSQTSVGLSERHWTQEDEAHAFSLVESDAHVSLCASPPNHHFPRQTVTARWNWNTTSINILTVCHSVENLKI